MKKSEAGVTVVELFITLSIAAAFLLSLYQLYVASDQISTLARRVGIANQMATAKLQEYEVRSFNSLNSLPPIIKDNYTPDTDTPTETFTNSLPPELGPAREGKLYIYRKTTTNNLLYAMVRVKYNTLGGQQTIELGTYIQKEGVGR